MEFHVEDHPELVDLEVLEAHIRREASIATGLGDETDLAIFGTRRRLCCSRYQRMDLGRLLRTGEPLGGAESSR